jgi:predicted outer membrane protein
MSRFFYTLCGLSACLGFSNLAGAQQPAATVPNQTQPQTVRPQTAQQQTIQQQEGAVDRVGGPNNQARMSVTQLIVKKLRKANEGEIALAQMAEKKSDNEELRKFTQMIVKDHQALLQQLDQVGGGQRDAQGANATSATGVTQDLDRNQTNPADRAQQNAPDQANPRRNAQGNPEGRGQGQNRMQGQQVPQQLWTIIDQACDNTQKLTMEMLQKYEGQDFQMGFLGQQIVAHTQMLGELQSIQSNGPQELKQIAQQATEKTQAHLEMAKQLAKKFEDDRSKSEK